MKRHIRPVAAALVIALSVPLPASAFDIVYDPTAVAQIINNVKLATQQVQELLNLAKMYSNMLQNTAGLGSQLNAVFSQNSQDLSQWKQLMTQSQLFLKAAQDQQSLWQNTQQWMALTNWSFDDLLKYDIARSQNGMNTGQGFLNQANQMLQRVQTHYQQTTQLQQQLQAADGTNKILQTMGQYLDVISHQLAVMNQHNAAIETALGVNARNAGLDTQVADQRNVQYQNQVITDYNNFQQQLYQMTNGKGTAPVQAPPIPSPTWATSPGAEAAPPTN